jgi:serine/threonine protein kinase
MKNERWEEVERLYHAALEHAPAARPAFLDEACAGDEGLRREVAGLLDYDDPGSSFIESPAIQIAARAMAAEPPPGPLAAAQPPTPRQIGAYQRLGPIGRGGMGEVHLALDTRLNRKVAIKLLPFEFTTDAGRVRRFTQEARAASATNHPNIITIHEIGEVKTEAGDLHYIVTEYVEGETLRQRLEGAPGRKLPPADAVEIAAQIAAALSAAHEAGIVHRDIKPENVMVRRDGLVKVLDFGLARVIEQPTLVLDSQAPAAVPNNTETGVVMGTPRYMSPEQARGQKVDARTDIFSLGVMLYEMVAGRAPFASATTSETIAAILRDEPPPLSLYVTDVPRRLEQIIGRAMRKDPAERHQSAKDLLGDLNSLKKELAEPQDHNRQSGLASPTADVRKPPLTASGDRFSAARRKRSIVILSVLALLLPVLAGIGVLLDSWWKKRAEIDQLEFKGNFYLGRWTEDEIRKGIEY